MVNFEQLCILVKNKVRFECTVFKQGPRPPLMMVCLTVTMRLGLMVMQGSVLTSHVILTLLKVMLDMTIHGDVRVTSQSLRDPEIKSGHGMPWEIDLQQNIISIKIKNNI